VSQIKTAAVAAGTSSQPKVEQQNRASQVPARLIRNGQASLRDAREVSGAFIEPFSPHQT